MKTITLSLLLFTILSVRAEQASENSVSLPHISLGEVTRVVLERNPAIQEALRKWDAAKERVTQERAWDDLKVSGTSRVRRYVDVAPNSFTDQMLSVEQ